MKYYQNLHTHTSYCDGKDSVEEMIQKAIGLGFDSIGFSGHSYMFYAPDHSMSVEGTEAYKKEVRAMKEKYKGKIDIFLGIEFDIYSDQTLDGYEYAIGSVQYLKTEEGRKTFDIDLVGTIEYINKYYGGDGMRFAKAYYEAMASAPEYGNFDIIGHFDLLVKNNDKGGFIDEDSKAYKDLGFEAIHALKGKIPLFEVNTGTISRGYKKSPYPQMEFLKEFRENGFGATISSDCHDKRVLDCYFEESKELLREAGFNSFFVLTANGFEEVAL